MDRKTLTALALFAAVTQSRAALAVDISNLKITDEQKVSEEEFQKAIKIRNATSSTYSSWDITASSYSSWDTTNSNYSSWDATDSSYSSWDTTASSYSSWDITASSYSSWDTTGSDAVMGADGEPAVPGPRVALDKE